MRHYQESLRLQPDQASLLNNLAWIRATHPDARLRDGAGAVSAAQRAVELSHGDPAMMDTLAAAYAEAGRFADALATARKALALVGKQNDEAAASGLRARIALYTAGQPYRQMPPQAEPRAK